MNLDYGEILKKAWKIIWKFKILWIFGILASCSVNARSGGGSGGGNSYSSGRNNNSWSNSWNDLPPFLRQWAQQIQHLSDTGELWVYITVAIIALLLFFVIIRLLTAALGTVGQIGLINGTYQVEAGAESLKFGALLSQGWKYFWKVILFKLLLLAFDLALTLVSIPLVIITCCLWGLALIPIGLAVYALIELAMVALVGDDMPIMEAITKAWNLFKTSWLTTLIMEFILGVIHAVVGLVMAIPVVLAMLPALFAIIPVASSRNPDFNVMMPGLIISGILILILIPISIFIYGVFVAYQQTAWVLVYRSLTGMTPAAVEVIEPKIFPDEVPPSPLEDQGSDPSLG